MGTVTEIYDYLRLLFASLGVPHCPSCGENVAAQRVDEMVVRIAQDTRINVMAPIVRGRKGEFKKELQALRIRGFTKARIDGQLKSLEEDIALDRRRNHNIDIVIDRLIVRSGIERRLSESVEVALTMADDVVVINSLDAAATGCSAKAGVPGVRHQRAGNVAARFLVQLAARRLPRLRRARPALGGRRSAVLPDESMASWARSAVAPAQEAVAQIAAHFGIDPKTPFAKLPKKHRDLILLGPGKSDEVVPNMRKRGTSRKPHPDPGRRGRRRRRRGLVDLRPNLSEEACPVCHGKRLRSESLVVRSPARRWPS